MKTFGEFFDEVRAWADESRHIEAVTSMDSWTKLVTPEKWQEARDMELTEGLFLAFAQDMWVDFYEMLQHTCTDVLYARRMEQVHLFQTEIASRARAYGLVVNREDSDHPLSFSDALIRAHKKRADAAH